MEGPDLVLDALGRVRDRVHEVLQDLSPAELLAGPRPAERGLRIAVFCLPAAPSTLADGIVLMGAGRAPWLILRFAIRSILKFLIWF